MPPQFLTFAAPMGKFLKCPCLHCGGRIEYPAEAAGNSATCPHCGQETDLTVPLPEIEIEIEPPRRRWLPWVLVGFVLLGLAGAIAPALLKRALARKQLGAGGGQVTADGESKLPLLSDFAIAPVAVVKAPDGALVHATGSLSNTLGHQRYGVRVDLQTLDAKGNAIGAATDYTPVIESNGVWTFRALVLNTGSVSARVTRIREQRGSR